MLRSVFLKTFHDQRVSLLGWLAAIALIVLMYAAIWPSVRNQPSLNDYLDQLPEAFRSLFAATGADMSTPVGYIQIELMSFRVPSSSSCMPSDRGRELWPARRNGAPWTSSSPCQSAGRVLLEKTAAMVVGTLGLAAATGATLVVEGRLFDMVIPVDKVGAAMLHLALLGLVFGALTGDRGRDRQHRPEPRRARSGRCRGVHGPGLGPMVEWLRPVQEVSPFYQYIAHDPLRTGVSTSSATVAVATVVVLTAVAVWGFSRRDIRG